MIMKMRFRILRVAAFIFALTVARASNAEESGSDDNWEFNLQVYGWIAAIDGTTASGDDFSLDFVDLVKNLNMAIMAGGGARKGPWSLNADLTY